jgi:hypothetical protein
VVASLVLIRGRDLVQEEPVEAPPAFDLAA